jgi:predicted 3-demethylubiquinone-9 3-methyltransferase (glyoxalase superfamily)
MVCHGRSFLKRLPELLTDKDKVKARKVMDAMLKMKKIVVADLEKAYRGE